MDRLDERGRIAEEFDLYYASFDPYTDPLLEKLEEIYIEHKDESSFLLKSRMIRMMCETCPVHLFKESPFFFEISSGRGRHTWGGLQSKAGSFLNNKTADLWLTPYSEELKEDRTQGFLWNWNNPVGLDHFCLGYDNILEEGLEGLLRKARYMMETVQEERKRIFLQAAAESLEALICLAGRFHQKALELADSAADEEERKHYLKIAEASGRVPAHRPETFYEALCAVIFCRECIGSVDGIGVSTFGQLDRMLAPFYEADAAAGRITPEEAKQLFHTLLTYTDVRLKFTGDYLKLPRRSSSAAVIGTAM